MLFNRRISLIVLLALGSLCEARLPSRNRKGSRADRSSRRLVKDSNGCASLSPYTSLGPTLNPTKSAKPSAVPSTSPSVDPDCTDIIINKTPSPSPSPSIAPGSMYLGCLFFSHHLLLLL